MYLIYVLHFSHSFFCGATFSDFICSNFSTVSGPDLIAFTFSNGLLP